MILEAVVHIRREKYLVSRHYKRCAPDFVNKKYLFKLSKPDGAVRHHIVATYANSAYNKTKKLFTP